MNRTFENLGEGFRLGVVWDTGKFKLAAAVAPVVQF